MKLYIDVTNLMHVRFISGIQRVVREITLRLLKESSLQLTLLEYNEIKRDFYRLDNAAFADCFGAGNSGREACRTDACQRIGDFEPGSVLLEMDSVWFSPLRRMVLYPLLKGRGVRIAVFYQDIIPILWPQYVERRTTALFTGYLAGCLTYADLFLTSAQANVGYLRDLMERLDVKNDAPFRVTGLGTDFTDPADGKVRARIREAADPAHMILMVGTVEPRKNHHTVLDAFDAGLFDEGYSLVIIGKTGWNVGELTKRIRGHAQLGKRLHWIEDATDAEIEYCYRHSFLVVFPSYTEGYGLPIVEALGRGVPVITSDHPVMREVGGEWCEYVNPDNADELGSLIRRYGRDETAYRAWRERIAGFHPISWDMATERVKEALRLLEPPRRALAVRHIRQLVILSARPDDLLRSLPFTERFMPFITEVVLCCPDAMRPVMEERYRGRLHITYLTDSEVLAGEELPEDHSPRNMLLRARAFGMDAIDPVFLMGDDDYRPLREISEEMYFDGDHYCAYTFADMRTWHGTQGNPTSFDRCARRGCDFLTMHGYPTYMCDSHMPQPVDKAIFLEMIERYPEMLRGEITEWNGYFNYLIGEYPNLVTVRPYVTMGWPGHLEDWDTDISRPEYVYENFYDEAYGDCAFYGREGYFKGLHTEFCEEIMEENRQKSERLRTEEEHHLRTLEAYERWRERYRRQHVSEPVYAVYAADGEVRVAAPGRMELTAGGFLRIPFALLLDEGNRTDEEWQLTWTIYEGERAAAPVGSARFAPDDRMLDALILAPREPGDYRLEWNLFTGRGRAHRATALKVALLQED